MLDGRQHCNYTVFPAYDLSQSRSRLVLFKQVDVFFLTEATKCFAFGDGKATGARPFMTMKRNSAGHNSEG